MKIIDCKQGTTGWLQARCGIPTASEFDNLVTPEWKPRAGEMPKSYLLKKTAERIMGYPMQSFSGGVMEQGSILEGRALPWFEFRNDVKIDRVGLCTTDDGKIGCSPDGLIGENGGIECKCPEAHTHLEYLLGGDVPKKYLAQVHGAMFVTGRSWWIFMSYSTYFPPLIVKVARDESIQQALAPVLTKFVKDLDEAVLRVQTIIANTASRA